MSRWRGSTIWNVVIAVLLGGVALGVIARLWPPAHALVVFLQQRLVEGVRALGEVYRMPGWLILMLLLLSAVTLARFAKGSPKPLPEPEGPHPYTLYTRDNLFGATWRWIWENGKAIKISGFCPRCDFELVYDDSSAQDPLERLEPTTDFVCERCNRQVVASIRGKKNYAISIVRREIYRRVRLGLYLQQGPQ